MRSWFKRLPYTYCLSIDFIYEVMVSKRSHTHIVSQQTLWLGQGLNAPIHILSLNRLYDWVKQTLLEFLCCLQGYRKIHRSQKRSHTQKAPIHILSLNRLYGWVIRYRYRNKLFLFCAFFPNVILCSGPYIGSYCLCYNAFKFLITGKPCP